MDTRPIPGTAITVSAIGLGTSAMGGNGWGHVDDRESIAAVQTALDLGVNLVDTAPIYGRGHAEEVLGKSVLGRREHVILATQCGFSAAGVPTSSGKPTRDALLREYEASLRRLRVDFIDLYQYHWPDPAISPREAMSTLAELFEQGAIGGIGLANLSCEMLRTAMEFGPVHAVQTPLSILQPRAAADLIPCCAEHGVAVLAYGVLAKGLLTGKFGETDSFEGVRGRDPEFLGNRYHRNLRTVEALRDMAEEYGKTPAQLAIAWAANYPGVTSAIVGAKRPSQVIENIGAAGLTLSTEHQARLRELVGAVGRES